jgi:H+/Cl- antiporter ClcA
MLEERDDESRGGESRVRRAATFDRNILGMSPALLGATLVVGLCGGVVGASYLLVVHLLQHGLWPDHWSDAVEFPLLALVGGYVVVVARVLGSPGDVELLVDNIHVAGGPADVRALRSLVPMSVVTIAAGGAAGPEAPLVTTCGTLASRIARTRRLSVVETRSVTIAGMAAAFTVLFGAPLGSALFSLEILHRRGMQYYEALVPAIVGSISGYACYIVLTGAGVRPVWHIPTVPALRAVDLLWALGAGVAGAVIAVVFTYLTVGLRRLFQRLPWLVRPIVGGCVLAALALWSPYGLTFGEAQVTTVLHDRLAAGALVAAILAKLLGTSTTVASGWPGGFIIPLFFMGATLGVATHDAFGDARVGIVCAALMAAANVGVTKTLLGSTLVVTEMGGLRLLPTTLLAATVAFMLTSQVGLIHSQRERTPREPEAESGDLA